VFTGDFTGFVYEIVQILSGIFYLAGTIFFIKKIEKRLNERIKEE